LGLLEKPIALFATLQYRLLSSHMHLLSNPVKNLSKIPQFCQICHCICQIYLLSNSVKNSPILSYLSEISKPVEFDTNPVRVATMISCCHPPLVAKYCIV